MTPPAPPGPPALIWTQAARDALDNLLDWLARQPWGDPGARLGEIHAAAQAVAYGPAHAPTRGTVAGHDLRWRRAGEKMLVVYVWDEPQGDDPGAVYIVHVAHTDQENRMPPANISRALRELARARRS